MVRSTNDTPYDFLQIAGDELVSLAFELKVRWFYFFYYYLDLGGCSESLFKSQSGLVWHFGKLTSTYLIKKYLTHLLVRLRVVSTLLLRCLSPTDLFTHLLLKLLLLFKLHYKLPTPLRVWRHQIDQQNKSSRLCLCKLYHLKHNVQDEKNTGTVKRYDNSLMDPKSSIITLQRLLFLFFIVCVYACSPSHFLC